MNLLKDRHTANPLDSVRQVADKEALLKMQKEAVAVHMADSLYEYVTRLSRATREHAMITLGLSSRGALAVCRMAKAHAYMEGRDYAVPEDVAAIFADVSGHRVILSPKAKMTETSASSVIESVLASVPMPAAGRGSKGYVESAIDLRPVAGWRGASVCVHRPLLCAGAAARVRCGAAAVRFVQSLPPDGPCGIAASGAVRGQGREDRGNAEAG